MNRSQSGTPNQSDRRKVQRKAGMAIAVLLATVAFASPNPVQALEIAVSLPTLAAIAREVAGPHATIHALVSPRQDPHYADARPNLILAINRADLLISNGLDLEVGWLPALVRQARNPKIVRGLPGWFEAAMHVKRLQIPMRIDRSLGDIHAGGNPHFGWDPRAAALIAEALGRLFGQLDPQHAADFATQATAFAGKMRALAAEETKRFGQLTAQGPLFVAYHDSLTYLVDWLNLKQVGTVEPRPGIPPDPTQLAKVVTTMRALNCKVLIQEEYYPRTTTEQVARLTQGRLAVLPGGVDFAGGQRYEAYVRAVTAAMYAVLQVK